jgi:hypothetical protein
MRTSFYLKNSDKLLFDVSGSIYFSFQMFKKGFVSGFKGTKTLTNKKPLADARGQTIVYAI